MSSIDAQFHTSVKLPEIRKFLKYAWKNQGYTPGMILNNIVTWCKAHNSQFYIILSLTVCRPDSKAYTFLIDTRLGTNMVSNHVGLGTNMVRY